MTVGTRSLLFGVHQFLLHPVLVLAAWVRLYGLPSLAELVCILIHDWGYWGCPNMDGAEGERHPEWAAAVARKLLGRHYAELCLYHSRHYARLAGREPSKLCWADKLSMLMEPWWTYLARAWLSGELREYRENAVEHGALPEYCTCREWHAWLCEWMRFLVDGRDGAVVPHYCDRRLRRT